MRWYGIIAFLFIFFALAGIVYIGANTDKIGINFGTPSAISKGISPPSNDLPPLSFPSFSFNPFVSSGKIDVDKIEREITQQLQQAQSSDDVELIMKNVAEDLLNNPQAEAECIQIAKDVKKEQDKMTQYLSSGNDPYNYPIERVQKLVKEFGICSIGWNEGWYQPLDPSLLN